MTWSPFGLLRRRLFPARRAATTIRKNAQTRRQLLLELLEDRTVPSTYSISSSFNATAVAPGGALWLSSDINSVSGIGSAPVTITVTNQTLTFTDTYGGSFNLSLPNATLTLTPGGPLGTVTFNTTNNQWVSSDPTALAGNLFLSGIEVPLPSGLKGSDNPVTWSANFSCDTSGISFKWAWAAAAYSSFSTSYSALGIKPCDSSTGSSYANNDKAGTPESYKTHVVGGGTGTGGTNYIGNLTPTTAVSPTYTPTHVSIAGIVYQDNNSNGVDDTGDVGLSGVTMTLSGTSGGVAVTATTTTNSSGAYTFTTDSSGNALNAGTYQVTEIEPVGYYQEADNVGTVNGTTDGVVVPMPNIPEAKIGSIALSAGQSAVNYNFGELNPFSQVTPAYPYSSSNPLTNVAFNESSVLAGASVNLANNTLDMWYTDEHALALGVSSVTVKTATGTTTTNYPITPLGTDPGSATNPSVGDTATTGTYAAVDPSGRPLFPSLYVTDITSNPTSTSGDWQFGGTAIPPTAVYGAWKPFTITVDQTTSPATVTQTAAGDPAANGWNLGPGADPVPTGLTNAGYGADVQWSLAGLYNQGLLIPGHSYRFYFIVHDGDQNRTGGDCGQAAFDFTYHGPVTISGNVYNDRDGSGTLNTGDTGVGGVTVMLTGTTTKGVAVTATTTTAADGSYSFTTDSTGNLLSAGIYQVTEMPPAGYFIGSANAGTVNGTTDGVVASGTQIGTIALTDGQNGVNYNFGLAQAVTISGTVYEDTLDTKVISGSDPGVAGVTLTLTGTNVKGQSITATTVSGANGAYSFTTDSNGNPLLGGTYQVSETVPAGYLISTSNVGGLSNTPVNWALAFQNAISGNGPGFAPDAFKTNTDNIFTGGGSKDVNGIYQWQHTSAQPQAKDDIEDGFGAIYTDQGSGHTLMLLATDRYSNGGDSTLGLWAFKNNVGVNANGTFSGGHTDGDILLTIDFASQAINAYRWTGTDTSGSLTPISLSTGESYVNVPTTAVSVPWSFLDYNGNTSPQPGEFMQVGLDLTALFGSNIPTFNSLLTETRSSNSTTSTLSDFVIGSYNRTIGTTPPDGISLSGTVIGSINVPSGEAATNYNFGLLRPVAVSGTVYHDTNGNNRFDVGDVGIAGVTLTLTGINDQGTAVTATTTTSAGGAYSFSTDNGGNLLRPGTYQVVETAPSGYLTGGTAVGTVNGSADGTELSSTTIGSIALAEGQSGVNYNFGHYKPVALSGTVYQDSNGNNVFDAGEPGIAGVTVTLTGTNGLAQSVTATTTTAADGTYSFTKDSNGNVLRPGNYVITETAPSGYLPGAAAVGTVNGVSDGTAVSATQIGSIGLTSGQSGINYSFGDVKAVTLSGLVYQDTNGNGVLDAGEPGIAGVTLTLTGTNGLGQSITATTTTATGGTYSFSTDTSGNALRPGNYVITESVPTGYLPVAANLGTVGGAADGVVTSATKFSSIALTSGQSGVNYNFGDLKAITLGGEVYQDSNGNNALDAGEPGITGVTVTLTGTNGLGQSVTATTTTGNGGVYYFSLDSAGNPLRPGNYVITETAPSGYLVGADAVGTVNGTADGTLVSATQIGAIILTSGQSGINYNFGDLEPVTVSGVVYQDSNGNDAFDAGEPGIAGVTVSLIGVNGLNQLITATTTTAADGSYSFTQDAGGNVLRPGTYLISETVPSGYQVGLPTVGTVNGTADGTIASLTAINSIVLTSGQNGINYLFGDVQPVSISGLVYTDSNGNGQLDAGEPGIAGVTLTLTGVNGLGQSVTATTTSAANGTYSFTRDSSGNVLLPGNYQIVETVPLGYLPVTAAAGTVNGTTDGTVSATTNITSIALTSGQAGINYQFSDVQPIAITGLVYQDSNGNNALDAGEPGIAGVTVTLEAVGASGAHVLATTTTTANGSYAFTVDSSGNGLLPGTYEVVETAPSGYLNGATTVGTVGGTTDGTLVSFGDIASIVLTSGQGGSNYDFGHVKPSTIGGIVYNDSNDNGVHDAGEAGISGIAVTLTGTNGLGQSVTATTTTAADGTYSFSADSNGNVLRPGTYQIAEVSSPSGYLQGTNAVGTVGGTADGQLLAGNKIGSIVLTSGQSGINYNFAWLQRVTVSGLAYYDNNTDGVYDTGDTVAANVTLTLTGTTGLGQAVTATTVSAANGTYNFTQDSSGNVLLPGTYTITETVPTGYVPFNANVGTVNGALDGTKATTYQLSNIVLPGGQGGINYNFGLSVGASVSGYVYLDNAGTQTFVAGDQVEVGATVQLTGTDINGNTVTLIATTNASGYYVFTGLMTGTYTVTLVDGTPTFTPEVANVGTVGGTTDGVIDSLTEIGQVQLVAGNTGVQYDFGGIYNAGLGS